MKRFTPFALIIGALLNSGFARGQEALVLKAQTTISGSSVTFNDLLETPVAEGTHAIFAAPALGETGIIQTARILEAAKAYNLPPLNTRGLGAVSVVRATRELSDDDITGSVTKAVTAKLDRRAEDMGLDIDKIETPLSLEAQLQNAPEVMALKIQPGTKQFSAQLIVPGSTMLSSSRPALITGRYYDTAPVLMLNKPVTRGTPLTLSDISVARVRAEEAPANALHEVEEAYGMLAKGTLKSGQILRNGDVEKPTLVTRNEFVTLVYQTSKLTVSTRGKALGTGTRDEVVDVINLQSKRTVQGKIIGPNKVLISTAADFRTAAKAFAGE